MAEITNIIQWFNVTHSEYELIQIKNPNALYYINDTKEIYKGNECYTQNATFVNELPTIAGKNKIYILPNLSVNIWNGTEWKQLIPDISNIMDESTVGLVTAEAIREYIKTGIGTGADNLLTTVPINVIGQNIGVYKDGDIIPSGTPIQTIIANQMAKIIPPIYKMPTLSIIPGGIQTLESGSAISPTINSSFIKNDAGDITKYSLSRIDSLGTTKVVDALAIQSYSQTSIVVPDGENLKFTSSVDYNQGAIKQDNLGNDYPIGQINAGTLSSTLKYVGKRKAFYGSLISTISTIDSDNIRALPQNILDPVNGTKLTINISLGTSMIIFAYPSTLRDITSVISSALNLDVKNTFTKQLIQVSGVNSYEPIEYKVYIYTPSIPFASSDTYTVTI